MALAACVVTIDAADASAFSLAGATPDAADDSKRVLWLRAADAATAREWIGALVAAGAREEEAV